MFKNLDAGDILFSPFEVHKTFNMTNEDSGSGVYSVPITKGNDSNLYGLNTNIGGDIAATTSKTISGSTFYEIPTYYMINSMFYRDITQMAGTIDYYNGTPKGKLGYVEYEKTRHLYDSPTNSSREKLRRPYTRQLHDTGVVISVPQELYGEQISKKSVRLTDNSTASTLILQDDGYGNLYDMAFSSSYSKHTPDANNSGSVVGNVFYNHGLLVITDTGSYSSVGSGDGSDGFNLTFDSTQTIYEREYVCKADENQFEHTNNRSLKVGQSGSVGFSGSAYNDTLIKNSIYDRYPYDITGFATGSYKNEQYEIGTELIGEATHSHFATYVTTIGLYNNSNELVAIGKTAKPIKNDKDMALTFVVRFDTN